MKNTLYFIMFGLVFSIFFSLTSCNYDVFNNKKNYSYDRISLIIYDKTGEIQYSDFIAKCSAIKDVCFNKYIWIFDDKSYFISGTKAYCLYVKDPLTPMMKIDKDGKTKKFLDYGGYSNQMSNFLDKVTLSKEKVEKILTLIKDWKVITIEKSDNAMELVNSRIAKEICLNSKRFYIIVGKTSDSVIKEPLVPNPIQDTIEKSSIKIVNSDRKIRINPVSISETSPKIDLGTKPINSDSIRWILTKITSTLTVNLAAKTGLNTIPSFSITKQSSTSTGTLTFRIKAYSMGTIQDDTNIKIELVPPQQPPRINIDSINKGRLKIISTFEELVIYLCTTVDESLSDKYRKKANEVIHQIPNPRIEIVGENTLDGFLRNISHDEMDCRFIFTPIYGNDRLICGVNIRRQSNQ